MARFCVTLLAGLVCLSAASGIGYRAWVRRATPPPVPAFAADRATHDFGATSQQENLTAVFRLTNTLPHPVTVTEVMKSCSCAKTELSTKEIGPGESAELTVKWDTRGRRGPANERTTLLYTAGGRVNSLAVQVQATVTPTFTWEPAGLTFSPATAGSVVVAFRSRVDGDRLTRATTEHAALTATVAADGMSVAITYRPPADVPTDEQRTWVSVGTSSPAEPAVRIPVRLVP